MSCDCDATLYVGNNTVLQLGTTDDPLKNSVTGTTDTGATVTATIYEMDDTEVTGETWPVVLSHAGSGIYRKTVSQSLNLVEHTSYKVIISATGTGGEVGKWTVVRKAEVRGCE
jgi:hypothetical protein